MKQYRIKHDYDSFIKEILGTPESFESVSNPDDYFDNLVNYIHSNLHVKSTESKGRGVFAKGNIKSGELMIVEKAIAYV